MGPPVGTAPWTPQAWANMGALSWGYWLMGILEQVSEVMTCALACFFSFSDKMSGYVYRGSKTLRATFVSV